MKKLLIQGLGAATIFSFSVMPVLGAPNGPAPKATGGISYEAAGLDRQAQFQMHDGDAVGKTDKGMFKYSDANGDWYTVEVTAVNVSGDMAFFAGPVVAASQPGWVGLWLSAAAHDGGEPGATVDHIYGIFTDQATAEANVSGEVAPGPAFAVTNGNLQVHSYE